jgi:hypothetical protein
MKSPFPKPKEFVISLVVLMAMVTFCYLAVAEKDIPQELKEVLMFLLGGFVGGKFALSGANGGGAKQPSVK